MVVDCESIPKDTYPWEIFIENRKVIDSSDLTLYINSLVDATLCPGQSDSDGDRPQLMQLAPSQ